VQRAASCWSASDAGSHNQNPWPDAPRVGDGHGDGAERALGALDEALDGAGVAHVDHGATDARLAEVRERALQRGVAHVTDRDAGPCRLERARDPEADAGAGDEHHLVLEVEHGSVFPRAMIR
jgi:hypothetical protein